MKKVGVARTYFLSGLESIKNMVDRGFPLRTIYDTLQPPMAYHQFTYYARKYIKKTKGHPKETVKKTKFSPGLNPAIKNQVSPTAQLRPNHIEKPGEKEPHFPPGLNLPDASKSIRKKEESTQSITQEKEPPEPFEHDPVTPELKEIW